MFEELVRRITDLARRVARLETQEFPGTVTTLNVGSATGAATGGVSYSEKLTATAGSNSIILQHANNGRMALRTTDSKSAVLSWSTSALNLAWNIWEDATSWQYGDSATPSAIFRVLKRVSADTDPAFTWIADASGTGLSERLRVLYNGGVAIGLTALDANYLLQLPNDAAKKGKANAWDTYASSLAWKRNVAPVADPLGKLAMLRGITFTHAPGRPMAGEPGIGIAAEELEMLGLPGLVTRDDQGEYSGINMTLLTPLLVEAINAQQAQIVSLRAEVAALRAKAR